MQIVTNYPDGIFAWVDLTTPDIDKAKAFYSGLLGWELEDRPTDGGPPYTMAFIEGHTVAGMGPMMPDMVAQGHHAYWNSYLKFDDVDAAIVNVTSAGGSVLMPPMDVMREGRMAIVKDPEGAIFGLWQPGNHKGAELVNAPNCLIWNELQAHDTETARAFYRSAFGWTDAVDDSGYITFFQDGRMHAGGMAIDPSWGEVPPNWSIYFMVEDVHAMAKRVAELGGRVINGPFPTGTMGEAVVVADPSGAVFTLMKFNGPVDPPPGV